MRHVSLAAAAICLLVIAAAASRAGVVDLTGGQTSILFDFAALESAGLTFGAVSPEVARPGDLPGSFGFAINPRNAALRPTTFSYDTDEFPGSSTGTIEHAGSVFFNEIAVQLGDFSVGYDAARAGSLGGAGSGFFVASNTGRTGVIFDLDARSALTASETHLTLDANLLVAPEFAVQLQEITPDLPDFTGADVGDARVAAVIPLPPAVIPGLIVLSLIAAPRALKRWLHRH